MQRLRPSLRNMHVGLALGIATAGVILALGGCAMTASTSVAPDRSPSGSASAASLDSFSESERERILAVQAIVAEAAAKHDLDPALINAMIWVESRFDPRAKSPAGAQGLMQLMPATAAYLAKRMGESSARAYDPKFNIRAGALYLAEMRDKFGDEAHAVAAYHAGPGNVKKWLAAGQQFPEYSRSYVAKVMDARGRFGGVETHGRPKHAPRLAAAAVEFDDEIVPDVDALPDAAEIHGVARVIVEQPEPMDEPVYDEPVFEPHPELDRNPGSAPAGWTTSSATTQPQPQPQPRPRPRPTPAPEPKSDEVGLGVLPDL
jgi:hypothetical protein